MARRKNGNGHDDFDDDQPKVKNGHNSDRTKAEIQTAHNELSKLEAVLETARAKVRNKYKSLKDDGFNIAALKRARKDLRDDPIEAQMDFEAYLGYRDLLDVQEAVEQARISDGDADGEIGARA